MSSETPLEFLQRKWRMWFKVLDLNNDKVLSRDDYKTCIANIKDYFKDRISDDILEELRQGYDVFWREILFGKMLHKDSLSEDDLIATLTEWYYDDRENFYKMVRRMMESVVNFGDIDGNGMISFKEFVLIFAAYSTRDEAFLRRMFNEYKPSKQDEIPLRPFIDTWYDFVTGDDPTKENIAIAAYTRDKPETTICPETPLAFLQRKWRMWFKLLDLNNDKILSRDDFKKCITNIKEYFQNRISDTRLEELRRGYDVFWGEVLFGKMLDKDTLTEDDLVARLTKLYYNDWNNFHQLVRRMMETVIKCGDLDGNGMFSFKEFVLIFAAFSTRDETFLRRMFDDYNPSQQDEIPNQPFIETWIDFVSGEDPSKENIAINAYNRDKPQVFAS